MSIMDDANSLRALVSEVPTAQIDVMKNQVIEINTRAADIIGSQAGFYQGIGASAASLIEALGAVKSVFFEFESAIEDTADFLRYQAGG